MRPLSLRTILVATDLTEALLPALQTALKLAALADARLHVIHCGEKPGSKDDLRKHLTSAGFPAEVIDSASVVEAPAAAAIVQEAFRLEADVIILGPHRQKRAGSIGSIADRVVRAASIPCLILPRALPLPLGSVLVPVDVAESARGPLAVGLTWASALRQREAAGAGTRVVALHVTPTNGADSDALRRLETEVGIVRQRLATLAGVNLRPAIEASDDPPEVILNFSESAEMDLIVLGTRAEKPVDGAMLGSVASAVVSRASVPILLVPPDIWRSNAREPLP